MPALKRQRVSAPFNRSTSIGITAFTRVSKAQAATKSISIKNDRARDPSSVHNIEIVTVDGKRKADHDQVETESAGAVNKPNASTADAARILKPLPKRATKISRDLYKTPDNQKSIESTSPIGETPTRGAKSLLQNLKLSSSPIAPSSSLLSSQSTDTSTTTYDASQPPIPEFPPELQDLINLNSAFLTSLSIHYAHNGRNSPADLRLLCPNIARCWGKRSVSVEDIRRVLAIMRRAPSEVGDVVQTQLYLSDYGLGKICIELRRGNDSGSGICPIDEDSMNETFVKALTAIWAASGYDSNITALIDGISLASISVCPSVAKMSPLLAKGQRRMDEIKAAALTRKDTVGASKKALLDFVTTNGKKMTLLERLQEKQRLASNLPPPPSKADLSRQAGLRRLEEVVAVLSLLTTSTSMGQSRISFTMPTVISKLKDSFRSAISKEEGEVCVKLLASEIAPEWVKVVHLRKMDQVIIMTEDRVRDDVIAQRIKGALRRE